MKKYAVLCFLLAAATLFFSFSGKRGGDVFEIYLNGKKMLQQFVHIDKSIKTLTLASFSENDRIEVLYSHCGHAGKGRTLTFRNEKNEVIKKLSFGDGNGNRSLMGFYRKEIAGNKNARMKLYYSSQELPEGKLLAQVVWQEAKAVVKL
ncbi:MAG: hypothetical protein M3Q06_02485 [Bacteroidota bacterium]|nr:hypothetical protein [Bacteroidota bacterium]